jgi:hypothetical protein
MAYGEYIAPVTEEQHDESILLALTLFCELSLSGYSIFAILFEKFHVLGGLHTMSSESANDVNHEAYRLFRRAIEYQMAVKAGRQNYILPARMLFLSVLEWATPETWPQLWWETRSLLNDLPPMTLSK